jgi:hypothetical protein
MTTEEQFTIKEKFSIEFIFLTIKIVKTNLVYIYYILKKRKVLNLFILK